MADAPPNAATLQDAEDDRGTPPGTPRWVKLSALAALVIVVLLAVLLLVGGGNHGPGRHLGGDAPSGKAGEQSPPRGAAEGHQPPAGGH